MDEGSPPPGPSRGTAGPRKSARRLSRELAMSLLFQHDTHLRAGDPQDPSETVRLFEECFSPGNDPEDALGVGPKDFALSWPFARELFLGVSGERSAIDREIAETLRNWQLDRLSSVMRTILRLAYYELSRRPEIPALVSLNEAMEIAKVYGEAKSAPFVNGVLHTLMVKLGRDKEVPKEALTLKGDEGEIPDLESQEGEIQEGEGPEQESPESDYRKEGPGD
ncbi:MAG: transcription antitermination factor NusB [Deltaproteobacteria bacterium]|nr:transcription antitermination factor NusB [Deltaproteobacteria bacterium]